MKRGLCIFWLSLICASGQTPSVFDISSVPVAAAASSAWDAPVYNARGSVTNFYTRVEEYFAASPDLIQCSTSPDNSTWTDGTTNAAPELDAPVKWYATNMTADYYVKVRYRSGGVWSQWSTNALVDTVTLAPEPEVENWNWDVYYGEYKVISYNSPAPDLWRIETSPNGETSWTFWGEGTPPAVDDVIGFAQPEFGGFAPIVYCRFRYHDSELDRTSVWAIPSPWYEP